jgi:hypothetical protein
MVQCSTQWPGQQGPPVSVELLCQFIHQPVPHLMALLLQMAQFPGEAQQIVQFGRRAPYRVEKPSGLHPGTPRASRTCSVPTHSRLRRCTSCGADAMTFITRESRGQRLIRLRRLRADARLPHEPPPISDPGSPAPGRRRRRCPARGPGECVACPRHVAAPASSVHARLHTVTALSARSPGEFAHAGQRGRRNCRSLYHT